MNAISVAQSHFNKNVWYKSLVSYISEWESYTKEQKQNTKPKTQQIKAENQSRDQDFLETQILYYCIRDIKY